MAPRTRNLPHIRAWMSAPARTFPPSTQMDEDLVQHQQRSSMARIFVKKYPQPPPSAMDAAVAKAIAKVAEEYRIKEMAQLKEWRVAPTNIVSNPTM